MSNTIRDGVRYFGCCLCDDVFEGYGNNPDPVTDLEGRPYDDEDECCDNCNSTVVVPTRMKEMGLWV
jgi:hypothetical protein